MKFLKHCAEFTPMCVGVTGAMLILVGGGSCFLGVSGKSIDRMAQILKPYQPATQKMINYGAGGAFLGLFMFGGAALATKTMAEYLADRDYEREFNQQCKDYLKSYASNQNSQ